MNPARSSQPPGRPAFTLVELLVVLAVIGVLLGLMIPAVHSAREAARRAGCQSRLKQLSLAVVDYHEAHRRFPPGRCGGPYGFGPDSRCWSWLSQILPHLEYESLHRQGGVPRKTLHDSGIADAQIHLFLCPSDPFSARGPRDDSGNLEGWVVGQTNYKGVSGANWGADGSQRLSDIGTHWPHPGTHGSWDGLDHGDGILWRSDVRQPIRAEQVRDGLSRTFLIGEDLPQHNRWCSWPYSTHAYGTCAIPPNYLHDDPNWWPDTHSFRSNHPGGLNFAMADGSVRFVDEEIDLETYRALATRAGGEPAATPR